MASVSVRAAVEPLNTALILSGSSSEVIFLKDSFVGLPLINQALAAENPQPGGSFIVTVRALIKVLGRIPVADVVAAMKVISQPPPKPPTLPPPPPPQPPPPQPGVTCGAELDLDQPGSMGITGMRIFGAGFSAEEPVEIIENLQVAARTKANTLGSYTVHVSFLSTQFPVRHTVKAHGELSGRTSNDVAFTV
jgi:hypothetical protein